MHLQRRESDLHLYSFRGLEEILLAQLKHAHSSLNYKVILHPLSEAGPELIFEDDHLTVQSFPMDHKIPTCGFLFREKTRSRSIDKSKLTSNIPVEFIGKLRSGQDIINDKNEVIYRSDDYTLPPKPSRAYAYCTDTQPSDAVLPIIHGVDLLHHEATFMGEEIAKARETRHSTAAEAAKVALQAQVRKLIIGHFSARYKDLNVVLNEARNLFPETYLAQEGEIFEIAD